MVQGLSIVFYLLSIILFLLASPASLGESNRHRWKKKPAAITGTVGRINHHQLISPSPLPDQLPK
ncbi:hypothetical protein NG798_00755 [Ancylothrix sp. C2]|nr:hypothetical protein [Ancylothrix sp. D3o]